MNTTLDVCLAIVLRQENVVPEDHPHSYEKAQLLGYIRTQACSQGDAHGQSQEDTQPQTQAQTRTQVQNEDGLHTLPTQGDVSSTAQVCFTPLIAL